MAEDNTIQPVTDDAELAKVLDGMQTDQTSGLNFEETTAAAPTEADGTQAAQTDPAAPVAPAVDPAIDPAITMPELPTQIPTPPLPGLSSDLDSIKKSALEELRPLVDKLNLPAEEKFDTLLLIIRSTDDQSLVSQAYDTARTIEDEQKRAEALLDIIKEIDYFANPQQAPAAQ